MLVFWGVSCICFIREEFYEICYLNKPPISNYWKIITKCGIVIEMHLLSSEPNSDFQPHLAGCRLVLSVMRLATVDHCGPWSCVHSVRHQKQDQGRRYYLQTLDITTRLVTLSFGHYIQIGTRF